MFRTRHHHLAYQKTPHHTGCPFCEANNTELNPTPRVVIHDTPHMQVIKNIFPYSIWEHLDVQEHLLVVPKRHVTSLNELNQAERKELMTILCKFEPQGYSSYTRAPSSVARSLPHVHTHLIKTLSKEPRVSIAIKKPYFIIKF